MAGFAVRAAGAVHEANAVRKSTPRVRVKSSAVSGQKPVITTMTIVVGAGMLRAWVVDKQVAPPRAYFVKMAILGFCLAFLSEMNAQLGKGVSYLVLAATIFAQAQDILDGLQRIEVPAQSDPQQHGSTLPGVMPDGTRTILYTRGRKTVLPVGVVGPDPHKQDWPRKHKKIQLTTA